MSAAITRWLTRGSSQLDPTTTSSNDTPPSQTEPLTAVTDRSDDASALPATSLTQPDTLASLLHNEADHNVNESPPPLVPDDEAVPTPNNPPESFVGESGTESTSEAVGHNDVDHPASSTPPTTSSQHVSGPSNIDHIASDSMAEIKDEDKPSLDTMLLRDLAADRKKAIQLRSDAQQQARTLRRLYKRFAETAPAILPKSKEGLQNPSHLDLWAALVQGEYDAVSSLLESIETSRQAFDRLEEQLSTLEWEMNEKEKKLYSRHEPLRTPILSDRASSPNPSELSSVSPSPSSRIEGNVPDDTGQESLPAEEIALDSHDNVASAPYQTAHATAELAAPRSEPMRELPHWLSLSAAATAPSQNGHQSENGEAKRYSLPVSVTRDRTVLPKTASGASLRYLVTEEAEERLKQYGNQEFPQDSLLAGAQFPEKLGNLPFESVFQNDISLPMPLRLHISNYSLFGIVRWLRHDLPSSCRSPNADAKLLQDLSVSDYEVTALRLPVPTPLGLMKNPIRDNIATNHLSSLERWLWGPSFPFSYDLQSAVQPPRQNNRWQARQLVQPVEVVSAKLSSTKNRARQSRTSRETLMAQQPQPDIEVDVDDGSHAATTLVDPSIDTIPDETPDEGEPSFWTQLLGKAFSLQILN